MDKDRTYHYSSKIDVTDDLDNIYNDQHEVCKHPEGKDPESDSINCYVLNVTKRDYYSLSWEEIAEATEKDEYLVDLKNALLANNYKKLSDLLKGKSIHCPDHKNGLSSIKIEDLSIYQNVIMVPDRIWAPESITYAFLTTFTWAIDQWP